MPSKVLTIFDSLLSNILTFLSLPLAASIFPSLWHTSIQYVQPNNDECQIQQESSNYKVFQMKEEEEK